MAYATYDYYTSGYQGKSIPEADFERLAERASEYIDYVTFGRAVNYGNANTALKKACCAIAETYQLNEQGGGIASESNDGISVSYISGTNNTKTDGQRLYEAAALYLGYTGLLYRGVD